MRSRMSASGGKADMDQARLPNSIYEYTIKLVRIAASSAIGLIHRRLIAVEASPAAVRLWQKLTQPIACTAPPSSAA